MDGDEEKLLQSVALQNAASILLARQRAEQERDRARAEADEARVAAQAANEAKSRFLAMMSHELRTPLGAIGGYAALLEDEIPGPLTDEQRKYIARIRHNQAHLLQLVNELLDLGKIESGRVELHLDFVLVQSVVDNAYSMIEPQVRASGLGLNVEAGDPNLRFYGDRERVEQILLNLLSNAVKFTARGGTVRITITEEADKICICVHDTGCGIPADKLEAVFEAFFQVEATRSRTYGGTGLGLAISRQLARSMGGDLTVKSALGEGSTFALSLPRGPSEVPGSQ
jgi:signal transduction histidine kinase